MKPITLFRAYEAALQRRENVLDALRETTWEPEERDLLVCYDRYNRLFGKLRARLIRTLEAQSECAQLLNEMARQFMPLSARVIDLEAELEACRRKLAHKEDQ